jgi:hypothetical protein
MLKGQAHRQEPDTSKAWYDVVYCATWEFEHQPGIWTPVSYYMYIVVQENIIIESGLALSEDSAREKAIALTDKLNPPGRKRKYVSVEKKYAAITNPLRTKLNGE